MCLYPMLKHYTLAPHIHMCVHAHTTTLPTNIWTETHVHPQIYINKCTHKYTYKHIWIHVGTQHMHSHKCKYRHTQCHTDACNVHMCAHSRISAYTCACIHAHLRAHTHITVCPRKAIPVPGTWKRHNGLMVWISEIYFISISRCPAYEVREILYNTSF